MKQKSSNYYFVKQPKLKTAKTLRYFEMFLEENKPRERYASRKITSVPKVINSKQSWYFWHLDNRKNREES